MAQSIFERDIEYVWNVVPQQQGPNHTVGLVLDPSQWQQHDPFLLLAEDWFERGVFDVHPHRGQETVTYVIEGNLEHYDNKAGSGRLGPGDVQWMTAGRGVIHKEDPAPGEQVHSLQLWLNLPSDQKMVEPRYQNLSGADMPVRTEDGVHIRVFSGSSGNVKSSTQNYVPVTMIEFTLEPGASVTQDLPSDYNGFIYVLEGSGRFGTSKVQGKKSQGLWLGSSAGSDASAICMEAGEEGLKGLLYAGRPVREPVVQYGPFVMNTKEQIREAIRDFQEGLF